MTKRLTVVLFLIGFVASGWAQCAGWEATAEARMACCEDSETCPMHAKERAGSDIHLSVSQAAADRCCASTERGGATPSHATVASGITLAVLANPAPALLPSTFLTRGLDAARSSTDVSPVATHLLLSVFLI